MSNKVRIIPIFGGAYEAAEANGNKYVIVRSFDDFKREITEYLGAV